MCLNVPGLAMMLAGAVIGIASAQEAPWDEKGIAEHLDQDQLSGELDGQELEKFIQAGSRLFTTKFTRVDGFGRPMATQAIIPTKRKRPAEHFISRTAGPDASACSSCHNDPVPGGAGDMTANVFVSEGFESADFDNTDPQFSNERGTNHIFGAGLIELLAREMTVSLQDLRSEALAEARRTGEPVRTRLVAKDIDFGHLIAMPDGIVDLSGVEGVDDDLVIRPFSQKGVMTSLRQFTVNALNDHHGIMAEERFGQRWTGEKDFDEDGVELEISTGDVSALVAWQATHHIPIVRPLDDGVWKTAAKRGDQLFDTFGCADCHRRNLPLESTVFSDPGPMDVSGTLGQADVLALVSYDLAGLEWSRDLPRDAEGRLLVPLFGDLKRHKIADRQVSVFGNELLAQRFVERNEFMTSELWGVGSTAPYGHRGDLTTLDEAIRAHGGAARQARKAYVQGAETDRQALIAFLKTLVLEP